MSKNTTPGARRVVPRSRGALSGIALIVLGIWGALIPFVGPYFNFSFTPDDAWHWTAARGWLEVLPGAAAFVAGVLLLMSRSRMTTLVASWLGIAAGAWFAVGPQLQDVWHIGTPGQPAGSGSGVRALEVLALFTLLGVVIVYFAATAFGRLSVVSLRDAHAAERREAEAAAAAERERQAEAARERDAAAAREREAAETAAAHERRAAGQDDPDRRDDGGPEVRHDAGAPVAQQAAPQQAAPRQAAPQQAAPQQPVPQQSVPQQSDDRSVQSGGATHAAPRSYEQPQAYPTGQQPQAYPTQQPEGYATAQPQGYATRQQPQHAAAAPAERTDEQPAEGNGEHQSLAHRLFHRR